MVGAAHTPAGGGRRRLSGTKLLSPLEPWLESPRQPVVTKLCGLSFPPGFDLQDEGGLGRWLRRVLPAQHGRGSGSFCEPAGGRWRACGPSGNLGGLSGGPRRAGRCQDWTQMTVYQPPRAAVTKGHRLGVFSLSSGGQKL
ncbi:hypothetical protein HJG60_010359 [Phyllostomus discolor]|uniref:Uncharacterized protein n=1 Tax=Phyllostomus discolor TaxID=89673 RepID=A0A834B1S1_9CHIR|nr:hypothetical protein HJG60_010359 [Phyllostomus discolor]